MKSLLFLFCAMVLFVSCQKSDHEIDSRFVSNQCRSMPATYLPDNAIQSVSAPNADGTVQVCDSMYTVSPSFSQKIQIAKHDGSYIWGIILFIVCLILIILGIRAGYNASANSYAFIVIIMVGICSGMGGAACIDWAHTKQADIKKSDYADQMNRNGNLSEFWAENLFK